MSLLYGNETAIIKSSKLLFKIGKYRIYEAKLSTYTRIFILDDEISAQYQEGLKRLPFSNKYFVSIGYLEGEE
jgi:hypothetical protein